jgi:pilus assembly protein Flp/PilA
MRTLINCAKSFSKQEKGATMIEYALVVGLIAIAAIGALSAFQGNLSQAFTSIAGHLSNFPAN